MQNNNAQIGAIETNLTIEKVCLDDFSRKVSQQQSLLSPKKQLSTAKNIIS